MFLFVFFCLKQTYFFQVHLCPLLRTCSRLACLVASFSFHLYLASFSFPLFAWLALFGFLSSFSDKSLINATLNFRVPFYYGLLIHINKINRISKSGLSTLYFWNWSYRSPTKCQYFDHWNLWRTATYFYKHEIRIVSAYVKFVNNYLKIQPTTL